jgi:hypothetical protein
MRAIPAMGVDFLDQQSGIATARASAAIPMQRIAADRWAGFGVCGNTMKPASLFDQLQQGAPAPALWRFWLMRCFRRELLPRHRIA